MLPQAGEFKSPRVHEWEENGVGGRQVHWYGVCSKTDTLNKSPVHLMTLMGTWIEFACNDTIDLITGVHMLT